MISSLLLVGFALSAPHPSAQAQLDVHKAPGAIKHAGIYHVATGQWTRNGGAVASFGPDVIYSNEATQGYFGSSTGFGTGQWIDSGGLPGTTNPDVFAIGANRDEYSVNCFELAYCDLGLPVSSGWRLEFYNAYAPCAAPTQPANATIDLVGLPAGGCWTVAIDLSGGDEFCMQADAGQVGMAAPFGWNHEYIGTDGTAPAGLILAGDPSSTDPGWLPGALPRSGFGTYYGGPAPCGGSTGYLADDLVTSILGGAVNCFGGNYLGGGSCGTPSSMIYSSFYLQMQADVNPCRRVLSSTYCLSNSNITGAVGKLEVNARPDPLLDDAILRAFDLSPNAFGYFIVSGVQGFVAQPGGSLGNLCLGGSIGRFVGPGQVKISGPDGTIQLSTLTGEWSTQAVPSPTGPFAISTGTTISFQLWHREQATFPTSNFTNGVEVNW